MVAADGNRIGEHDLAVEEDGNAGGAAAHVDQGDAKVLLVLDQAGEPGSVGRYHQRRHLEVAAIDAGGEIAHRAGGGGDNVHGDAEPFAVHAARVADAAVAVDGVADRNRMNDLTIGSDADG